MSYLANVYNVMIASPGDVQEEREIAREVIHGWNSVHASSRKIVLLPLGWEHDTSPETGDHPQEVINRQILDHADILIGIFWTRIGTPTNRFRSGTVEEIEKHINAGKPAMLYFSNKDIKPSDLDHSQYNDVLKLKQEFQGKSYYETFSSANDFEKKFTRHLSMRLNDQRFFSSSHSISQDVREDKKPQNLSQKAVQLLFSAAKGDGTIIRLDVLEGLKFEVHGQTYPESNSTKEAIQYEEALEELELEKLVKDISNRRQIFQMTTQGFVVAESLTL